MWLESNDSASDDVAVSQLFQSLVDVVEPDSLQCVLDLSLLGQRDDFAEIVVVAPEGTVVRKLAGDEGEEWNVDARPDQPDRAVRARGGEQVESHLNGFFGADAVHRAVDLFVAGGFVQLCPDVVDRFPFDVDHVIRAVFFGDRQLLVISSERHDRRPGRKQLRVLDGISSQTADADDRQNSVRPKRAGVAQFLDASVRRESRICERRQLFDFQIVFFVDADEVLVRDRDELPITAGRAESRPTSVPANLCVARLAEATGPVAHTSDDDHLIALDQCRRFRHEAA